MYKVFDQETQNITKYKRFSSQFIPDNWVIMRGWKNEGDTRCSMQHIPKNKRTYMKIEDDVDLLVGLNIKFDLLWEWRSPDLIKFFKRGGKIWDCQYAEYLLGGMKQSVHMVSMDKIVQKYGGRKKIDAVKELWEAGMLTSEIDPDMLEDYLIGTEAEKRNSGDIGNTELIFLGQIKKAKKLGMLPMIEARMDGLLCTTEMEYNGLHIDIQEAKQHIKEINAELEALEKELAAELSDIPPELGFNWQSRSHVSCLLYGGAVKYTTRDTYIDEATGELACKFKTEKWPMVNGEPVDPKKLKPNTQDRYVSGKKKGDLKYRAVKIKGDLKYRNTEHIYDFDGYVAPNLKYKMELTDARGEPLFQTGGEIIEEIALVNDIPFLKALARRQSLVKDLGTYYVRNDGKEYKGMLLCVMPDSHLIHHHIDHTTTVTSRLSSSNPNLQNIPRADTSRVKKLFNSRFKNGKMIEIDYSQLEVVVQGLLSGDKQLIKDLNNKIDFHCKRVAAKMKCTYKEALFRCKDSRYPEHDKWKSIRTDCKTFSFQRAYGAGAPKISASTGIPVDDVKALIEIEEAMYPGIIRYNQMVENAVKSSSRPFPDKTRGGKIYHRGQYQCPTGTIYTFRTYDAPEWLQKKGYVDTFMPTELKNYPVQGTGGEIVQIVLGRLWRHFLKTDNYKGRALLCNTVHDCVWTDVQADVEIQVAKDMQQIMESVPELLKEIYGMDCPVPFPVEVESGDNLFDKQVIHVKGN